MNGRAKFDHSMNDVPELTLLQIQKLLSNITIDGNACWLWQAGTTGGYGQIRLGAKRFLTHRIMYHITHPNEDIANKLIRHTCDTPRCNNPNHLVSGTHRDNLHDQYTRNRRKLTLSRPKADRKLQKSPSYYRKIRLESKLKST